MAAAWHGWARHLHLAREYWLLVPGYIAMGTDIGLTISPGTTDALGAAAPQQRSQASGIVQTVRQVGGVIGIAVLGAIVPTSRPPRRGRLHRAPTAAAMASPPVTERRRIDGGDGGRRSGVRAAARAGRAATPGLGGNRDGQCPSAARASGRPRPRPRPRSTRRDAASARRSLTPSFCIPRYRCLDGPHREDEAVGDLGVAEALRGQVDELGLAGESARPRWCRDRR